MPAAFTVSLHVLCACWQVRHPADRRVEPGEPEAEGHRDLHRGREAGLQLVPRRTALRRVPQGVPGRVHVQRNFTNPRRGGKWRRFHGDSIVEVSSPTRAVLPRCFFWSCFFVPVYVMMIYDEQKYIYLPYQY